VQNARTQMQQSLFFFSFSLSHHFVQNYRRKKDKRMAFRATNEQAQLVSQIPF